MDMMLFFRKYGFLFIPPVYWLIYLGVRLTYNGLAGEYSPDFFQGIRHEGIYIICSLCIFYFFCLEVEVSDGEFSANILFLIVFFHVVLLFITLLICLWQGAMLLDAIFMGQIIASMCLLFFIPVLSIIRRSF
ncbi:TPA: hypothetical protein M4Y70_004793 [Klebsiella variicola]|uniref:hypothetical protein n=1 Tax=Klebsiella pneumoniae complex TaxID=3390273 RepID=UPI00159470DA|nr:MULTISPECIES: hypothetical protein [Klebsiella]EKQ1183513.1 hypothetical protein [Klebsiella pneumoniae]MDG0316281.1 hypothetical protein [Klebsiella pneumoniae]HBQ0382886.1 hypothetical protein [Klebsiella variicola]HCC2287800.1 hypothetical protein [Klebsiella variicola]HCI7501454.1 hypothetical protein [Klebsiella pneumoniae]